MKSNRKNASEFMDIFDKAHEKLIAAEKDLNNTKEVLQKKLRLINYQQDYVSKSLHALSKKIDSGAKNDKLVLARTNILSGIYDSYGSTVHPAFVRTPNNILNFMSSTGAIFKNNMVVKVNEKEDEDFLYALMHDSIANKGICIKEYDSSHLTLEIETSEAGAIGDMKMNTMEILPYLLGSFNINRIEFYERNNPEPVHQLENLIGVGAARYILSEKIHLTKVTMDITLTHTNPSTGRYVFGLQHLYFYNGDFNKDSYIVVNTARNKTLEYIYEDVVIGSQFGAAVKTTAKEMGIEFYLDYDNGQLLKRIETSTEAAPSFISMNTKDVYIKIPLRMPLVAVTPNIQVSTAK